jgi:hypothetical protein
MDPTRRLKKPEIVTIGVSGESDPANADFSIPPSAYIPVKYFFNICISG